MSELPPEHRGTDGRFRNPPGSPAGWATRGEFWRFLRSRLLSSDDDIQVPEGHVLTREAAAAGWEAARGDKLQWLGHSAFRWQLGETIMLSDPLLKERASPLPWLGPKRFVPSPLRAEEAECAVVLITHCHYDHLDLRTLRELRGPHGGGKQGVRVVTPLGVGRVVRTAGLNDVTELDWHESTAVGDGIEVTLTPAVHFSARTPFDRNCSLWGGYVVRRGGLRVYVSGDTAHHPTLFKEVGARYGPVDYALVPIGAYEPRCIMAEHHATPEEGVAIGLDVGARTLIGHHWGAIRLTTEDPFEPPGRFLEAVSNLTSRGSNEPEAWVMRVGETREIGRKETGAARP